MSGPECVRLTRECSHRVVRECRNSRRLNCNCCDQIAEPEGGARRDEPRPETLTLCRLSVINPAHNPIRTVGTGRDRACADQTLRKEKLRNETRGEHSCVVNIADRSRPCPNKCPCRVDA